MDETLAHTEMIPGRSDLPSTSLLGTSIPESMDMGAVPTHSHPIPQPNNFPPPKTDKPRPHVCGTCGRCFARLEHLKRHERSHTKEKPFECPECTRCFARRDLLLRHQQKLHMSTTAPARPRGSRRESSSSNTPAKVRKNSSSQAGASGQMRPRANTISHVQIDALNGAGSAVANITNISASPRKRPGHSTHPSLVGLPTLSSFEYRGVAAMPRNRPGTGLPKIETQGLPMHLDGNLRTAPAYQGFPGGFTHDQLFTPGTINPAQLHFSDSPSALAFDTPISPFLPNFNYMNTPGVDDGTFDWVNGFDASMTFGCETNEYAIDESSPSAMSTGSPAPDTMPEVFSQNAAQSNSAWQSSALSQAPMLADYTMDISPFLQVDMKNSTSPNHGLDEQQFHQNLNLQSSPFLHETTNVIGLHPNFNNNADTPTASTASVRSSNRHSSVTSIGADAITDATRSALISCLSQSQQVHHRNFSSPTGVKPKIGQGHGHGHGHARSHSVGAFSLPSTADLQRYITAYTRYFHPHLPFLHIPTLSFDPPVHTNHLRAADSLSNHNSAVAEGKGCLILAMAAIGALYEFENAASQELFQKSKKMIQAYLEEHRKNDISMTAHGRNMGDNEHSVDTPLWLVQSMLLNVIYGHNCGDQVSAEIASTHCAALVSLARSADLARPTGSARTAMHDSLEGGWSNTGGGDLAWHNWKVDEEKKRTLYAVYILSSMLVSAYNHPPALTNSEILLDLPCDEDVWAADSYESWMQLGGKQGAMARSVPFAEALGWLLGASSRQQVQNGTSRLHHPFQAAPPEAHQAILPISTFGCLILMHSLHNYIWETRQRHLGRQWTSAETEAMHAHIEPALIAWHQAWKSHPHHSLERPNPFGMGPLSADSIPLLDLAYVRLFVNLGRSKEAFWQRDWEQMSFEIARGAEIVQHAESDTHSLDFAQTNGFNDTRQLSPASQEVQSTRRERQLRKAAYHAAHSLCTSERLGVTFADFTSRELPIVSAMCAFDCAQVLAEWVTTIQERVGKYLGILGNDKIEFDQLPAIMMLDMEDVRLFEKIEEFLQNMELKKAMADAGTGNTNTNPSRTKPIVNAYGSKILLVTLEMLEQSAVWPIIRVMARSLESQAQFMEERALRSISHSEPDHNNLTNIINNQGQGQGQVQVQAIQSNSNLNTGVKAESVF